MNIDVDLPALEDIEEFDEMPALVSEEFEAAPRFLAVPIDLLWRNTCTTTTLSGFIFSSTPA